MNSEEYVKIKEEGRKLFSSGNHEEIVKEMMDSDWEKIKKFPQKDYEETKKWQLKRISYLVDYAYQNIPLYKSKYDEIGFKIGDIKTWDDYDKLPILYKEELINGFPNDIVKEIKDFALSTRSSGSSGKFVTIAVSKEAIYKDTIQGFRQYYMQSNNEYHKNELVLFIYTCPWWIEKIGKDFRSEFLPTTTSVEQTIDYIKKNHPSIISTYPTYLEKIASCNIKLSDYGVKAIIVHSEQSNIRQRKMLSELLGVSVLDEYSSEELTRIALECPENNYHIEEYACYIETYNPNTLKKCKYGEEGVVIGTNLLNTATPIIKYWQGDIAIIDKPIKCKCGNRCRILTQIKGRYMDNVFTPDGEIIPA